MFYEVIVEYMDNKDTFVTLQSCNSYLSTKVYKSELVFGCNPFFEIVFFLSKRGDVTPNKFLTKYEKHFILHKNALHYYHDILDFIVSNPFCEIL